MIKSKGFRFSITVIVCLCVVSGLYAKDIEHTNTLQLYGVYYFPDQEGYGIDGGFAPVSYQKVPSDELDHHSNDPGRSLGSTWGSAKGNAVFDHTITIPVLTGTGALTRGNNLSIRLGGELSPVSLNAVTEVKLTPIAFFNAAAGVKVGTGWSFFGLFNGLGRNLPGKEYTAPLSEPLSGAVFDTWLSATVQFDLAAVWPGEWHHVVTQLTPSIHWRGFTGAGPETAWEYEADGGMNFNGFKFRGSYFLGYQMPIALDTVGFLLETSQYIGEVGRRSPMSKGGWGSDFVELTFGPLANISFSDTFSLTMLTQFQNGRDYSDESIGNRYFEYREVEGVYIDLYRVVFITTFTF
jgi:hypothetical protein